MLDRAFLRSIAQAVSRRQIFSPQMVLAALPFRFSPIIAFSRPQPLLAIRFSIFQAAATPCRILWFSPPFQFAACSILAPLSFSSINAITGNIHTPWFLIVFRLLIAFTRRHSRRRFHQRWHFPFFDA
jgi:hypothetical protein